MLIVNFSVKNVVKFGDKFKAYFSPGENRQVNFATKNPRYFQSEKLQKVSPKTSGTASAQDERTLFSRPFSRVNGLFARMNLESEILN